jgi:hypothetical protein
MKSESFGRLIAGPVGSGKTTAMIMELLRRACEQAPGDDGLRHTRFAIVRQTLSQLKLTILKDIHLWLAGVHEWRVSESTIFVRFGSVRSEWLLIPLEEMEDQRRLLSSQLTGAWISEAIEIDLDLVSPLAGRCGRFPSGRYGVPTWRGIIADTNFPTIGSAWQVFMENPPPMFQIFKQPGGRTAGAENLEWLNQTADTINLDPTDPIRIQRGRDFYALNAQNTNIDWVHRYVDAQYGADPSGTAVFKASFRRAFHVVRDLEPTANRMILIGQDFGRQPWSLITQLDHKGRLLVLEEVDGTDTGLEQHIKTSLRPAIMQEQYMGHPVAVVGDPAGRNRSSLFEMNEYDLFRTMGFTAFPAPTNDLDPRLRAVESFLLMQREGGPAILIDEDKCPRLIEGLGGQYRFANTRGGVSKPTPDKNKWSHVCDTLQYVCLVASNAGAYGMIYGRVMGPIGPRNTGPKFSSRAWT